VLQRQASVNSDQRPQVMSQSSVSSGTAVPATVTAAAAGMEPATLIPSHISELTQVSGSVCQSACYQLHLAVAVLLWFNDGSSRL